MLNKYVLNLILIVWLSILPVCAKYMPIPSELSYQYKIDIESFVNSQNSYYKQKIDDILAEYSNENNIYVKQTYCEQGINSVLMEFYMQLVEITNNYVNIKENISPTDYPALVYDVLQPYFKDNNVNMKTINSLLKYARKKTKEF